MTHFDSGFFLNDEQKLHINLTEFAWSIIEHDLFNLYYDMTKSGMINTIILNFCDDALSSISLQLNAYRDHLYSIARHVSYRHSDDLINALMAHQESQLRGRVIKTRGFAQKFRLSNENALWLGSSPESVYYDNNPSLYVKNIIEEYTRLTILERERVIQKPIMTMLESAIDAQRKVLIGIGKRQYSIIPYAIRVAKENTFHYLIGLDDSGKISTMRLSRMSTVSIKQKKVLSTHEKTYIENMLSLSGPQFVGDEIEDFIIRLTPTGIRYYKMFFYNKPMHLKIEDANRFYFRCTRRQIIAYFFRFGSDAIIEKPFDLAQYFRQRYKQAYECYHCDIKTCSK